MANFTFAGNFSCETSVGTIKIPKIYIDEPLSNLGYSAIMRGNVFVGHVIEAFGGSLPNGPRVTTFEVGDTFTIGNATVKRYNTNSFTVSLGSYQTGGSMEPETTNGRVAFLCLFYTSDEQVFCQGINAYPLNGDTMTISNRFVEWNCITQNTKRTSIDLLSVGNMKALAQEILGNETPSDPYARGDISTTGGGTGNFDATSDTIVEPTLPSLSAINTGFLTLFVPTISQLASLQQYLWGDLISGIVDHSLDEIVDSLNKLVANPYDAIMGLSILPVAIPTSGSKDVKMYGVLESGVQMPYASTQWVTVDCGSLNINEFWGAYLDYSPYTKVTSLYLPYIGTVTLDVDEIMNKTLQVKYHVDVLTGQCVAYIIINGSVEYQYQGECAVSVPVTAQDFSGIVTAGMSLLASGLSFAAGGAAASAATAGLGAGASASKIATAGAREAGAIAGQAGAVASGVGNVMNMKPNIKAGGPIGGAGGILAVQKPYLIIIRPRQCVAEKQNTYTGYPLNKTMRVGDCSGYTEFSSINLDGIPLTDDEKAELQAIMMGGVYL